MKMFKLGLFGCMVNNDNMGCCALTYSLINLIEKNKNGRHIQYIIFERNPDATKVADLAEALGIKKDKVVSEESARFIRFYEKDSISICKRKIAECDLIIDLTQGDSFTDIYGLSRFISYTLDKLTVEKLGIPLVLGPQTYGPYLKPLSKLLAKKVIQNAYYVMSRDAMSKTYLDGMNVKKSICVGTDLAVGLPYVKRERIRNSVGINISGLLWPDKMETGTDVRFSINCDYKELMIKTTQLLIDKGYEVFFISHVGADYPACSEMKTLFPMATLVDQFDSPVEAKSFISGMEVFIGARMHATIAAFTSAVPVIPIAYSRKFRGFFENCNYDVGVDLTQSDTIESFQIIEKYLNSIDVVQEKVICSREIAYEKYDAMRDCLCEKVFASNSY